MLSPIRGARTPRQLLPSKTGFPLLARELHGRRTQTHGHHCQRARSVAAPGNVSSRLKYYGFYITLLAIHGLVRLKHCRACVSRKRCSRSLLYQEPACVAVRLCFGILVSFFPFNALAEQETRQQCHRYDSSLVSVEALLRPLWR